MARRYRDYYELLGVTPNATREEIHRAYRNLARRYHPDVNAAADARARFDELSDAYEVLYDPARRARYDRSVAVGRRRAVDGDRRPVEASGAAPASGGSGSPRDRAVKVKLPVLGEVVVDLRWLN